MRDFTAPDTSLAARGAQAVFRALPAVLGLAEIPAALVVPGVGLASVNAPLRERAEEDQELLGFLAGICRDPPPREIPDTAPAVPEGLVEIDETFRTRMRAYRVVEYALPHGSELRLLICRLVRSAVAPPAVIRSKYNLTEQEARVAFHLAHGRGNRAIARELGLTERTVRHHVERIMRKLDTQSRTEAAHRIWCISGR